MDAVKRKEQEAARATRPVTPVPQGGNFTTGQWTGPNFHTYVGSTFNGYDPSAQLTVMWHEFMHAAKGGTKLADALIDLKTPNVPGQFGNRTANIYEIAKKCGTALPPGF